MILIIGKSREKNGQGTEHEQSITFLKTMCTLYPGGNWFGTKEEYQNTASVLGLQCLTVCQQKTGSSPGDCKQPRRASFVPLVSNLVIIFTSIATTVGNFGNRLHSVVVLLPLASGLIRYHPFSPSLLRLGSVV